MKSYAGLLFIVACLFSNTGNTNELPISMRIVGGIDTKAADAPFIVSLRKDGQHYCGGSLVSSRWVLTAAHCIEAVVPDEIVAGTNKLEVDSSAKRFAVEAVYVHPNYDRNTPMSSDFALIKLKSKSSLPIAWLNKTSPRWLKTKEFTTAGWGSTFEGDADSPSILQSVKLPLVSQSTCEKQLQQASPSSTPHLDSTMFCAGIPQGGKDSCQGDSGGPMFFKDTASGKFVLAGVVSWGFGCARANLSGIYSDVSSSYKWILNTMYQ